MTDTAQRNSMFLDEFKHQLPDLDQAETDDWIQSLDDVVQEHLAPNHIESSLRGMGQRTPSIPRGRAAVLQCPVGETQPATSHSTRETHDKRSWDPRSQAETRLRHR